MEGSGNAPHRCGCRQEEAHQWPTAHSATLATEQMRWGLETCPYSDLSLVLHFSGTAGDWKSHFTVTQAEVFEKRFQEKTAGLPRELFPWE